VRALVVVPRPAGLELAASLRAASATRSARKDGAVVAVRVDPAQLG
jgi:hypothetical protein